jgi:hypothetical protein
MTIMEIGWSANGSPEAWKLMTSQIAGNSV